MKHPFHTLYYTGLSVLISLLIFGGLLIYNLSNIVNLIPKEKTSIEHSDIEMNPVVLETSIPKSIKLKNSEVEQNGNTKPETSNLNTDNTNKINSTPIQLNDDDTTKNNGDTTCETP
jgi:hypothetical protein